MDIYQIAKLVLYVSLFCLAVGAMYSWLNTGSAFPALKFTRTKSDLPTRVHPKTKALLKRLPKELREKILKDNPGIIDYCDALHYGKDVEDIRAMRLGIRDDTGADVVRMLD